jgi:CRP-like cAMP-binding protein
MSKPTTLQEHETLLAESIVFRAFDQVCRQRLASQMISVTYTAGSSIFHIGDPGHSMMVVVRGVVRISLPTPGGREVILADLERGAVLGEIALLDGKPRSATATALTDCELLKLPRSILRPLLRENLEPCLALIDLLCERVRTSDERMVDIGLSQLSTRLAKALLRRFGTLPDKSPRTAPISQSELADMVGSTRESVNRMLNAWHRQGIVCVGDGRIEIRKPDALAARAGAP